LSAALDLARYAVGHPGPDELGVTEVGQPVNALRAAALQQERRVYEQYSVKRRPGLLKTIAADASESHS